MMKRAIATTILAACVGGLGAVAAAEPLAGPPAPAAHAAAPSPALRVVAPENRTVFAGCAEGATAAALLAGRRDASALASADASFQTCMRSSRDQNDVAAAELGVAVTAFFAAQTHVGPAAISDYNRAVGYAHQSWSRSLNARRATSTTSMQPAPGKGPAGGSSGVNFSPTGLGSDSATSREVSTNPGGVAQAVGNGNTSRAAAQGPVPLSELAQGLEAAAVRARADVLAGKQPSVL